MNIDTTLYMACQDIKELVYIRKSTTVALPLRLIPEAITHPIPACRALSLSLSLSLSRQRPPSLTTTGSTCSLL